jgi:AcrR family transcriptional regulator
MDTEKVLDIAMTAYWQTDPADVSVNAITQMAGISKPSLYRAFGSEDGLSRAVLDRYAEQVLSEMFLILHGGKGLRRTLDALIDFASGDPRMETGCLFYKMRAGKHRLGPDTLARVEEIDAAAQAAYVAFLQAARNAGARAMTFSRRSTNSQRASSMVSALLSDGIALKSKLSRLLVAGNFAALMRRSIIRRSRSISSSSQSRSRNWT